MNEAAQAKASVQVVRRVLERRAVVCDEATRVIGGVRVRVAARTARRRSRRLSRQEERKFDLYDDDLNKWSNISTIAARTSLRSCG